MKLSIVIVDYLNAGDTLNTLRSLRKSEIFPQIEVIIVDNSPSIQEEYIQAAAYENVTILSRPDNPGFGASNNFAVSRLRNDEGFVWFLNNDTLLDIGALEKVIEYLECSSDKDFYGTILRDFSGNMQAFGGGKINWLLGRTVNILSKEEKLDYIHGASMIVPLKLFRLVGGFDERFFMYFEDVDLSIRLRNIGARLRILDNITVYHKEGGSIGKRSLTLDRVYTESSVYFFKKHYIHSEIPVLSGNMLRLIKRILSGNNESAKVIAHALRDSYTSGDICMVTGHIPAENKDAVGDYTIILSKSLGADIKIIRGSIFKWFISVFGVFAKYRIIHIQYPSEGWGISIKPGFIPAVVRKMFSKKEKQLVLTLHEWASAHPLRKISIIPIIWASDKIVFVDSIQRESFNNSIVAKIFKGSTEVIPIGNNVDLHKVEAGEIAGFRESIGNPDILIGYFGFIYSSKQPKKMVDILKHLLAKGIDAKIIMAGDYQPDHIQEKENFLKYIDDCLGNDKNSLFYLGYVDDSKILAKIIKSTDLVLALYDDGVSARRSSFWYAVDCGVPVITTSPISPLDAETAGKIMELQRGNHLHMFHKDESAEEIAQWISEHRLEHRSGEPMSESWEKVSEMHRNFYDS